MRFKWRIFLASAVFSSVSFSCSSVCTSAPGVYMCENGTVKNIWGLYGCVALKNVEVTNNIKGIIGAIDIEESTIKRIGGNIGALIALKSKFLEKIEGNIGTILLKKSVVKEINSRNPYLELDDSKIEKVTLLSKEKEVTITLKNKSMISGNIVFVGSFGKVCVDESSELMGDVTNGQVIKGTC